MEEKIKELKELLDKASVLIGAIGKDVSEGISARNSLIEEQRGIIENRNNTITALVDRVKSLEEKLVAATPDERGGEKEADFEQKEPVQKESDEKKLKGKESEKDINSLYTKEALAPIWMLDKPGPFIDDIREAISLNDRLVYVNDLFGQEVDMYEDMIAKINKMSSLADVLDYARSMFPDWDEGSDSVYRFYMTVRRRF